VLKIVINFIFSSVKEIYNQYVNKVQATSR